MKKLKDIKDDEFKRFDIQNFEIDKFYILKSGKNCTINKIYFLPKCIYI